MVVIGPADNSWAFEVEALIGIERIDAAKIEPAPTTVRHALGAFTSGVTHIEGQCVTVLDAERVLAGFKAALV
jgi:chemotaxis signal transduction protein